MSAYREPIDGPEKKQSKAEEQYDKWKQAADECSKYINDHPNASNLATWHASYAMKRGEENFWATRMHLDKIDEELRSIQAKLDTLLRQGF